MSAVRICREHRLPLEEVGDDLVCPNPGPGGGEHLAETWEVLSDGFGVANEASVADRDKGEFGVRVLPLAERLAPAPPAAEPAPVSPPLVSPALEEVAVKATTKTSPAPAAAAAPARPAKAFKAEELQKAALCDKHERAYLTFLLVRKPLKDPARVEETYRGKHRGRAPLNVCHTAATEELARKAFVKNVTEAKEAGWIDRPDPKARPRVELKPWPKPPKRPYVRQGAGKKGKRR